MKRMTSITLSMLIVLISMLFVSSSFLSSVGSPLTLLIPAVFASSSYPPISSMIQFESFIRIEKNDPSHTLIKPIPMSAGACREVNCGPVAPPPPPPNPCQNIPGTIFWPSSGQCVPSFCPPGNDSEIRGARLNSGLCDPAFSGDRKEELREEGEDEFSMDDDAPSAGSDEMVDLMGGLGKKGPLGIPEESDERPVVGPGPVPVPVPVPEPTGVIPQDPPVDETSLPGQTPEPLIDENTQKILLIAGGVILIVGLVLIFPPGAALAPAAACGGCLYE